MQGNSYNPKMNGGALFSRQKKSQNSPDMGGDFTLDGEVLDYVMKMAERGQPVKLELSVWRKMSRANQTYLDLKVSIPYAVRKDQQPQHVPSKYPQRNYQQQPPNQNMQYAENPQAQGALVRPNPYQAQRDGIPNRIVQPDNFSQGDRLPAFTNGQTETPPWEIG